MSPAEINRLCTRVIEFRDLFPPTQHEEKELLADVCDALDGYAKLTRKAVADLYLYEAVRALCNLDNGDRPELWQHSKHFDRVRAALAKAEGQQ